MKKESMKEHDRFDIDIVVMWVNPNDDLWLQEKAKYTAQEKYAPEKDSNLIARYRDWDNLRYWFRGIERFAPWVRTIHFVTWRTVPSWLNTNHSKLNVVLNGIIRGIKNIASNCFIIFNSSGLISGFFSETFPHSFDTSSRVYKSVAYK